MQTIKQVIGSDITNSLHSTPALLHYRHLEYQPDIQTRKLQLTPLDLVHVIVAYTRAPLLL